MHSQTSIRCLVCYSYFELEYATIQSLWAEGFPVLVDPEDDLKARAADLSQTYEDDASRWWRLNTSRIKRRLDN